MLSVRKAAEDCGALAWADGDAPSLSGAKNVWRPTIAVATSVQVIALEESVDDERPVCNTSGFGMNDTYAARVKFTLPRGSYATVLLAQMTAGGARKFHRMHDSEDVGPSASDAGSEDDK
eukprot:gnl/TRDRNA2_/TRDRNA2_166445_c2_seq2.p2 gnl/TRDRNA2_/TRDRNA2_166445_c2~~gnl/TRDRNA2_/TRDRNA2_166445_c2_seq2.p2  ORF type:complete len:120 (+),score=15.59 gnl/TRDRNA2_/TRDRNA2_166445_c2_seq2:902-1261(+)